MVHDQSSTGSTFFIEPMQAVDLNNEMRELQVREQDEIERILATLSNRIAEVSEGIIRNYEFHLLTFLWCKLFCLPKATSSLAGLPKTP